MLRAWAAIVVICCHSTFGWNLSLPIQNVGGLLATTVTGDRGNISWRAVVDTGSSDTVLLAPSWFLNNGWYNFSGLGTVRERRHTLFVDSAVVAWPAAEADPIQPRALLSTLPISISTLAGATITTNATVLLSTSIAVSGGSDALAAAWSAAGSVLGVLGSPPQLASPSAFTSVIGSVVNATAFNAPLALYGVLHLWDDCGLGLSGARPCCTACQAAAPNSSLPANGTAGHFTIGGSAEEVLAAAGLQDEKWALPAAPLGGGGSPTGLLSSSMFDLAVCGVRLLPKVHQLHSVFDSGALCLTLPAEAFHSLMRQLGPKVLCAPAAGQADWPGWATGADGHASQCKLATHVLLEDLPWLHWSTGPSTGAVSVPLASLVQPAPTPNSTARWLCVQRGVSVASAMAAATPQLAQVVMGSLLLRSVSVLFSSTSRRFALLPHAQQPPSAGTEDLASSSGIVMERGPSPPGCLPMPQCAAGSVLVADSAECRVMQTSCSAYSYFDSAGTAQCSQQSVSISVLLLCVALLAGLELLLAAHGHALGVVAQAAHAQPASAAFQPSMQAALASVESSSSCLACVLRLFDRYSGSPLPRLADPAADDTGHKARLPPAAGSLQMPTSTTRGAFVYN